MVKFLRHHGEISTYTVVNFFLHHGRLSISTTMKLFLHAAVPTGEARRVKPTKSTPKNQ